MPEDFIERRQNRQPVEQERRVSEKVAILEVKVDYQDRKITDNELLTNRLIEKLDEHIVTNTERDAKIQENLTSITQAVTQLSSVVGETNGTLRSIASLAERSNIKLVKIDTVWRTLMKIGSILAFVLGAGWTVYTYVIDHAPVTTQIEAK